MEPYWVNGDYDTGTQKTVQALANRLCSIYGVTLNSSYTDTSAPPIEEDPMLWALFCWLWRCCWSSGSSPT